MSITLFDELKRRNVFKVCISYVLLGWVVLQIADVLVPALSLPDWTIGLLFTIGLLGLPFAIFLSWAFELTPDGIKRESDIESHESITAHTGRKLDFAIIGLLVFALGYFVWESRFDNVVPETVVNKPIVIEDKVVKSADNSTIAVLPFVNMSSDPEQEYFSDGISEELLNLLAKIPELQVAARTSSFQFKGKKVDIKTIAEKLGVRTILEGSIRKSGNKVRITAQLIKADDGFHMWSETYDRELDDIFKIQDEISAAIVSSLKTTLGIAVEIKTTEPINISSKAYDYYLRGLKGLNTSTFPSLKNAQSLFQQAVNLEPSFIPAKIGLATSLYEQYNTGSVHKRSMLDRAEELLNQVLEVNPQSAEALYILSLAEWSNRKRTESIQHFKDAFKLDPENHHIIPVFANFTLYNRFIVFLTKETLTPIYEKMIARDPLNFDLYYSWGVINTTLFMDYVTAEKSYNRAIELAPYNGNPAYFLAALASRRLGDLVKSAKYHKLAYQSDLTDPDGPIALSTVFLSLGELDNAIHYADLAIEASPNSGHAISVKAQTLLFQDKEKDALKLVLTNLNKDEIFHRRFSEFYLVHTGIYLHLKLDQADEALSLLIKHYPDVKDIVDAPPPEKIADVGFPLFSYATIMRAKNDHAAADKLLLRMSFRTEEKRLNNRPSLNGLDYFLLANDHASPDSVPQTLTYLNKMYDSGYVEQWRWNLLWNPTFMHLQDHPEFLALVARIEADMQRQRAFLDKDKN